MEIRTVGSLLLKCTERQRFITMVLPFHLLQRLDQQTTQSKKCLSFHSNVSGAQVFAEAGYHTTIPFSSYSTPREVQPSEFKNKVRNEMFKPRVPEELAIDLVSRLYGLEITEIKKMNSFSDQNFHIKVSKNYKNPNIEEASVDGYTLKIMNTFKSDYDGRFDARHEAMRHLHKKGLNVPQPIRALDGKTWHLETVPLLMNEGKGSNKNLKCGIQLLTYIPGATLASVTITPDHFFKWGSMLATFHTSLEDLDCPALKHQPSLTDMNYFFIIKETIGNVMKGPLYDDQTKSIVKNILERIPSEVDRHMHNLPQGFIHGDFNDHNILVQCKDSGNATHTIDGILDFDELHFGTYVWDLGMMLAHVLLAAKTIDPLEAARQAIAGYKSRRQLSELELSLLKPCIGARLVTMTLIRATAADKDPNNTYVALLAPLKPKIEMLKLLDATAIENF